MGKKNKAAQKKPNKVDDDVDEHQRPEWTNRERVLVFCSRGSSHRDRHLMIDLKSMLPHSRSESKMDKKQNLTTIIEMAELRKCSKIIYLENRKRKDLYMWLAASPKGPSVRFLVKNVHTMAELRLSGNALKGSRPVLSFDDAFSEQPHLQVVKELLTQTFATPQFHPQSKPFVDRVLCFSIAENRIWMRNYQIVNEDNQQLEEIGPRCVLEVIKIFDGAFSGSVIYENNEYVSPNEHRRKMRLANAEKYNDKVDSRKAARETKRNMGPSVQIDQYDTVFDTGKPAGSDDDSEAEIVDDKPPAKKRKKKSKKPVLSPIKALTDVDPAAIFD